jgi:serine/threonine-protein kinase
MNTPSNSPTPVGGPPVDACPDTQELSALLDEQPTPGAEHGPLTQHIENCPACQRRLDELAGRGAWLDSLSTLGVSPMAAGRPDQREPSLRAVMDDLHRQPHASRPRGADSDLAFLAPADAPGYVGRLGPYEVIDVVGRGGMGIVLKAHDPALGRTVAIKVMAPVLAASQTARKRFVREARAAAAISHENVVTIHAVDEAHGLPYLVMQFVAGQSLEDRIRESGGPLPVDEAVRLGAQTALGLAAAHAHGVIHRDVKPANIMLESGTGRVKLTDFGLAHAADEASVTVTGQVSGTPSFMAPEQARGERVDARADLFSLGCVLYAACAGRAPFNAPTPLAALRAVCDDEPPPLSGVNPDVPPWLAGLVHALLRKDPTQRPSTAREVADELASHLGDSASPGPRTGHAVPSPRMLAAVVAAPRRRRKRVPAVVAASLLLIAGMLALAEMSGVTRLTGRFRDRSAGSDAVADPAALAGPGEVAGGPVAVIPQDVAGRVRTFASLADAVSAAVSGETIELRHDDRVPAARVDIGRKALRIRAGDGFRPTLAPAGDGQAILTSGGALVLEGITFEGTAGADAPVARGDDPGECLVVITGGGPVYVANCRFVVRGSLEARLGCLRVAASPACEIRNTEVHALQAMGVQWIDL